MHHHSRKGRKMQEVTLFPLLFAVPGKRNIWAPGSHPSSFWQGIGKDFKDTPHTLHHRLLALELEWTITLEPRPASLENGERGASLRRSGPGLPGQRNRTAGAHPQGAHRQQSYLCEVNKGEHPGSSAIQLKIRGVSILLRGFPALRSRR